MTVTRRPASLILAALAVSGAAFAQDSARYSHGSLARTIIDDVEEFTATGGVRFVDELAGLDVRCDRAMLVLDRSIAGEQLREFQRESGLPTRGATLPASRRAVDESVILARIESFLAALRGRPVVAGARPFDLELFRSLYLEGDVAIVLDGVEVLRADSLSLSPIDDRAIIRNAVLRLRQRSPTGVAMQVSVRAAELTRQAGRFTGRNVSITTSTAGEPQFDVLSADVEIRELPDEFEVFARGNELRVHGQSVMPLPDQHLYTATQDQLLIKGGGAGWSERLGAQARILWGSTWNDLGGSLHETLTGRPAEEFRGQWRLGTGFVEKRGFPVDAELDYRGGELWSGRTVAFGLDDDSVPIGPITSELDGTPIGAKGRSLVHSENRVRLSDRTDLDLTLFDATDPSIWAEFYRGAYYEDERPETSAHLRHRGDQWLGTITGRTNLTNFAYADGRELTSRFVGEEPMATVDFFSLPLVDITDDAPLLFTSSTGLGRLRSEWDPRAPVQIDDATWRLDQELELSLPLRFDAIAVRPFVAARYTAYEHTPTGGSEGRSAFVAGAEVGTRVMRTYLGTDGEAWRHELLPTLRYESRFAVDGDPSDFYQFDAVDSIDDQTTLRVGLLQRLLSRTMDVGDTTQIREEIWFDLAQNITPISERDNGGHHLGLFEFELLIRTLRCSDDVSLGFLIEGEQDWNENELHTFNAHTELRTGATTWSLQYRSDDVEDGLVGYGVTVPVRRRWELDLRGAYDFEASGSAYYSTNLIRNDLDWRLVLGVVYDVVTDDTTFRVTFEPRLGGLVQVRDRWSVGGYDFGRSRVLDY